MSTEKMPATGIRVRDDRARNHYVASLDGDPAGTAAYERSDGTIVFTHTVVDEELQGQGVATALIRHALDDARADNLTVIPQCAFVASFIHENPEYRDLLG